MLRDAGATKLAEAAEDTINRLREIGAPDFCEDEVIRTILKQAAKTQGTKVESANRNPETPGPALGFLKVDGFLRRFRSDFAFGGVRRREPLRNRKCAWMADEILGYRLCFGDCGNNRLLDQRNLADLADSSLNKESLQALKFHWRSGETTGVIDNQLR
jgi:hypothetical protein